MQENNTQVIRQYVRQILIAEGYGNIINSNFGREFNEAQETRTTSNPAAALLIQLIEQEVSNYRTNAARPLIPILKLADRLGIRSVVTDDSLSKAQDLTDQTAAKGDYAELVKQAYAVKDRKIKTKSGEMDIAAVARKQGGSSLISKYLSLAEKFIDDTKEDKKIFLNLYNLAGKTDKEAEAALKRLRSERQDKS